MDNIPKVFKCEYELLKVIWNNGGEMRMRDLTAACAGRWKHTTVYAMIKRMSTRNIVTFKCAKVRVNYKKEEIQRDKAVELIDRIFEGDSTKLLHAVIEAEHLKRKSQSVNTGLECNLGKYECYNCKKQFIIGLELLEEGKNVVCPYCKSPTTEMLVWTDEETLEDTTIDLGCLNISNINNLPEKS